MANKKEKEELTKKMHSEFSITEEADKKFTTWTALQEIEDNLISLEQAMEDYGITEEDIKKYKPEFDELGKKK